MAEEITYLELSENSGSSHKFYEVTVSNTNVSIRFGRIGDPGRTQLSDYASYSLARRFADKKISEKLKKGYERAIVGQRQKRSITRRFILSNQSSAKQAPILWKFDTGSPAFGIYVDNKTCWVGNQAGNIFGLDHNGQVQINYHLPEGVKCLVGDDIWLYAGCDDGNVYDISGKIPRVSYQIAQDVDIYWLDVNNGVLGVSDADGRVARMNYNDECEWLKNSTGCSGWMVRCGDEGICHGHSEGVTMYSNVDGNVLWKQSTRGSVLFGWNTQNMLYVGTSDKKIYTFDKKGVRKTIHDCDDSVFSCAATQDDKYIFSGDSHSSIYCFTQDGQRLWKLGTGCGSAYSMQYMDERLYIVTTSGVLACIDVSETAIQAAKEGDVPKPKELKAPPVNTDGTLSSTTLETTTDIDQGIILECIREKGKLRMRVVSDGFDPELNVQFPKNIREENVRYLVDAIKVSATGSFYRAHGNIKKIILDDFTSVPTDNKKRRLV
jgi:outer membrane protein assembly factor BamB/predicted DNA-binding WGR domain protein